MTLLIQGELFTTTQIVLPAKAGIQETIDDTGFRVALSLARNDKMVGFMWLCKALASFDFSINNRRGLT
jgi:hypothetical protein